MKKARNGFIKTLPYLCLVGVIALGLMTIIGTGGGGGGDGSSNLGTTGSEYVSITNISPPEGTVIDRGTDLRNNVDYSVTIEWSFEGSMAEITGAWVWGDGSYTPVCHDESGQDYWNPNDCFDDIVVTNNNGSMTYSWTNHNWIGYPATMTFRIYMWTANGVSTDSAIYY